MKTMELKNLQSGAYVQSVKTGEVLEVVGMEAGKYILSNGKTYSTSTIKRWFNVVEIPEVVEPDNTVINDIEQAEDLTQEQDTENEDATYEKNLDYKYLGDIILLGHKYSMLEQVYTKSIWFCTVDIHSIFIGNGAIGGITLNNGNQMFNCVRSEAELDNEVRILIVKKDYINRFQGKNLKVKIRHAFKELNSHNIPYISKHCPYNIVPKSFWTDVVLPLKEGKDILPKLTFYSSLKSNEEGAYAHIGQTDKKLYVLEVNPKVLPTELVNKLRAWGFKDSYITEGYLININMAQLGDDFIPIFNEIASIVDLPPMEEPGQEQPGTPATNDTQVQEQQDTEDTQEQDNTANTNTGKTNTGEGTIQQNNLIQSLNSLMDLHGVKMEAKKEYIKVSMEGKRGALCMIRQTRYGALHIDFKSKVLAQLTEEYRGMLIEQYNCHIYDRTRGYYRVFDCNDLEVLRTIILTAKQVA